MSMLGTKWKLHGNGKSVRPGEVVRPDERLTWPLTVGIGMQHVVAMFGATFLVPIITGMPPATTLFFSGIGTLLFLVITQGRVPSYLGSSFAFIAPIMASQQQFGVPGALGGVVLAGATLAVVGAVVQKFGAGWINRVMPPIVTGAIVALIGLNLAPAAKANFDQAPVTAFITLAVIIVVSVLFRGMLGRLSILVGVLVGYLVAMIRGEVDFSKVDSAGVGGPAALPDSRIPPRRRGPLRAGRSGAGGREHRPREVRVRHDGAEPRRRLRPRAAGRRRRHCTCRSWRRVRDHHLRREHRRHGRHQGVFDGGVLGGRRSSQ